MNISAIKCGGGIFTRSMTSAVPFVVIPAIFVMFLSVSASIAASTGGGDAYNSFLYPLTYPVGNILCLHDSGAAFSVPVMQGPSVAAACPILNHKPFPDISGFLIN